MCKNPDLASALREELSTNGYTEPSQIEPYNIANLTYLNALINETLRLHPPVPGPVFRDTPPEGLRCGEHFIPSDVTILTPTFAIQTSDKAFKDPMSFVPERWTSRPDLVRNKNAFFPFLIGTYGCVGKQVALMELRTVLSKLVLAFDIEFAKGEDGRRLCEESLDCFTTTLARMDVELKTRKGAEIVA